MAKSTEPGSETAGREVTNGFWSCRDISDIVPLYTQRSLYLKPTAKINVSVNLPLLKTPGKTISTWDVMEKIRRLIRPDQFGFLKVVKNTLEFIRLEGDVRDRSRLSQVLARLDSQCLKLEGFPNTLRVRAVETKDDFPTRHSWDSYFRDAKHMNELKAGERPDTIHISGLPVKWFCDENSELPSEGLIKKVFSRWGTLRRVDVPAADPYRSRMRLGQNIQKFSFEDGLFFDAYIQYIEYMDFVRAMDALRGMKLLKKEDKDYLTAAIKVDFDKTKHMSDNSVSHRAFERKRLIAQDSLAAEKLRKREEQENKRKEELKKKEEANSVAQERRRNQREEKRKRKAITIFRKQEEDKVSMKIAREERKLIKAQRQLESIRLLDALFDRIKIRIEKKEIDIESTKGTEKKQNDKDGNKSADDKSDDKKDKKMKKKKKKKRKKNKKDKGSNSSSSDDSGNESSKKKLKSVSLKNSNSVDSSTLPYPAIYPRFGPQPWYYDSAIPVIFPPGRGFSRERRGRGNRGRGRPWRGDSSRSGNPPVNTNFFYDKEYYKYFANLTGQNYHSFYDFDRNSKSKNSRLSSSRSRSRSSSRKYKRRKRRSRSDSRSRSKSRSRSRSRNRSRNRSKSRSRRKSRSKSRSPSKSKTKSKAKSRSRSRSSRDKSRRSDQRTRSRSRSKAAITRAKSKSPVKRKSRSSSWSLPKTPEKRRSCSWSKFADEKA